MPEYYSSIGEAVGAAMQHNIRLAYRGKTSGSGALPQPRNLSRPSAEPHSVPGMIARSPRPQHPTRLPESSRTSTVHFSGLCRS